MEKHIPANGDLPPVYTEKYSTLSTDILFKVWTNLYAIGFFNYEDMTFVEYESGNFWPVEDIECWWYLPE